MKRDGRLIHGKARVIRSDLKQHAVAGTSIRWSWCLLGTSSTRALPEPKSCFSTIPIPHNTWTIR